MKIAVPLLTPGQRRLCSCMLRHIMHSSHTHVYERCAPLVSHTHSHTQTLKISPRTLTRAENKLIVAYRGEGKRVREGLTSESRSSDTRSDREDLSAVAVCACVSVMQTSRRHIYTRTHRPTAS